MFASDWRGGRSDALDRLLSLARELKREQRERAEAAFPVHRMDEDDDLIMTTRAPLQARRQEARARLFGRTT